MIHIGLGSWADPEYTRILYPRGLPAPARLATYAQHFTHVEVNSSYYVVPKPNVVAGWIKQTPADFTFSVKLPRAFAQSPAKTARESPLGGYLLEAVRPLVRAGRLSAFLLVLPPRFAPDRNKLEDLVAVADRLQPHALAIELRHAGWVKGRQRAQTLDFFRANQWVWVAVDMPRRAGSTLMPVVDAVTHPRLAYLRLHGRNRKWLSAKSAAERHTYDYGAAELRALAQRARGLATQAADVYVIANNHARDYAPRAALALTRLLVSGKKPAADGHSDG